MKSSLLPRICCVILVCCATAHAQTVAAQHDIPALTGDELAARVGGPTRVTLHLKNVKLSQAVDALAQQAGISVSKRMQNYWKQTDPLVSIDVTDKPFWTTARLLTPPNTRLIWSTLADSGEVDVFPDAYKGATNASTPAIPLGVFSLVAYSLELAGAHPRLWDFRVQPETSDTKSSMLRLKLFADPKLALAANGFWPASGSYQCSGTKSPTTPAPICCRKTTSRCHSMRVLFPRLCWKQDSRRPRPARENWPK